MPMSPPHHLSGMGPAEWLEMHARRTPEAPCLVAGTGEISSYATIADRVARTAGTLVGLGTTKGTRLATLATDSVEYAVLILASLRLGATLVPLNYRLTAAELHALVGAIRPEAIFADRRYCDIAIDLAGAHAISTVCGLDAPLDHQLPMLSSLSATGAPYTGPGADDEDVVVLPLTSGTTGTPKAVMQSQRMIKAMAVQKLIDLDFRIDDMAYAGAPLFHMAGFSNVIVTVVRGASALLVPQFHTDTVLRWMQTGGMTRCVLMPSMVISLLAHPDVGKSSYAGLRSITYGGAPMPPSVIREMSAVFGCDLYNGFGAGTEAGSQTVFTPADHRRAFAGNERMLGSIGRPVFGCDLELRDEHGAPVPAGTVGEIHTRSDTVMSGYLGQPELTAKVYHDGWFHSGDMAYADADGYLHLAGRRDDMIIRGGENIFPAEIEATLAEHPAVREIAVFGVPDEHWGEIVAAAIVPAGPGLDDVASVREYCRGKVASYKVPTLLVMLDEMPRNATGKVQKRVLREQMSAAGANG